MIRRKSINFGELFVDRFGNEEEVRMHGTFISRIDWYFCQSLLPKPFSLNHYSLWNTGNHVHTTGIWTRSHTPLIPNTFFPNSENSDLLHQARILSSLAIFPEQSRMKLLLAVIIWHGRSNLSPHRNWQPLPGSAVQRQNQQRKC